MPDSSPPSTPSPPLSPVLSANALHWKWEGQQTLRLDALAIPPGVTWLGGGEGRGKTTLLRLLAGDLHAPGSTLVLAGAPLAAPSDAYRQRVFWMDPRTEDFEQISAVQFLTRTAVRYPTWDFDLLEHLVDALGLRPHQDKLLYMLSTGSKRKVWIAAALAAGTPLTLLDSPFSALDKASIGHLLEFFNAAAQHPKRAWVIAEYQPPPGIALAHTIDLGD